VHDAHGVEGDVDAAGRRRDLGGVLLDRRFVEDVDLCGLGPAPLGGDVPGDGVEGRPAMKTFAPSRANTRATAPPMAPPPP
jgi:hypothetical protein